MTWNRGCLNLLHTNSRQVSLNHHSALLFSLFIIPSWRQLNLTIILLTIYSHHFKKQSSTLNDPTHVIKSQIFKTNEKFSLCAPCTRNRQIWRHANTLLSPDVTPKFGVEMELRRSRWHVLILPRANLRSMSVCGRDRARDTQGVTQGHVAPVEQLSKRQASCVGTGLVWRKKIEPDNI